MYIQLIKIFFSNTLLLTSITEIGLKLMDSEILSDLEREITLTQLHKTKYLSKQCLNFKIKRTYCLKSENLTKLEVVWL